MHAICVNKIVTEHVQPALKLTLVVAVQNLVFEAFHTVSNSESWQHRDQKKKKKVLTNCN